MNVTELNKKELMDINGGNWFTEYVQISAYLAGDLIGSFVSGFTEGFEEGFDAVR